MSAGRHRRYGSGARRERGMSMTAFMALSGVAAFVGLFAIKAGPVYFENMTVRTIVDEAAADPKLMSSPRSKVYEQINTQYRLNNLWGMKAEDTVTLRKDGDRGYVLRVAYEKREPLFANIDLVMSFDEDAGDS